ncbi:hypothetical protein [Methylobacterium sp. 174MFSha1.1]|uniref:hypothetical protein n=1 Tax=Methylobacterium sp. 174MFSha1.1 TaxID=1502749 RepID=UPI0015A5285F|nr:hypothetical protein [Methylobacterium sp. 174MFSha1.1]
MASQPDYSDSVWDDYETEEANGTTRTSLPPLVRIGIAVLVVALAVLALSRL